MLSWLKVRENIHEDPTILELATRLKTRPEHVVGYCIRFWGWVSRNTADGCVRDLSIDAVENVLNLPHFLHHLCDLGWLEYVESTTGRQIIIPKFDRHLSEGAKKRALDAERKRSDRVSGKRPKSVRKKTDKITTREEKRREEKKPIPKGIGNSGASARFVPPTIEEVSEYCKERGNQVDPEQFRDHYEARGWELTRGRKVRDWKACVRTWEKNSFNGTERAGTEITPI